MDNGAVSEKALHTAEMTYLRHREKLLDFFLGQ